MGVDISGVIECRPGRRVPVITVGLPNVGKANLFDVVTCYKSYSDESAPPLRDIAARSALGRVLEYAVPAPNMGTVPVES